MNEINAINPCNSSTNTVELERANSLITELKDRLKIFENQMLPPASVPKAAEEIEETKDAPIFNHEDS